MEATATSQGFSNARVYLDKKGNVLARAVVKVGELGYVTGLRVVDGKQGLFVSMPSKKNAQGEYQDIFFPASKEAREQLSALVLDAYHKAVDAAKGA